MKKDRKGSAIVLFIFAIVFFIVCVGIFLYLKNNNSEGQSGAEQGLKINQNNTRIVDGEKVNSEPKVTQDRDVGELLLTNIVLQTENDTCKFTADVVNNALEDFQGGNAVIGFRDMNGAAISYMETVLPVIKSGESYKLDTSTTADVVNASDFTIEIVK